MEPWGIPALTGYSREYLPCRTIRSHLLLRKEEIRPNIWPEIPNPIEKKTSMPNPIKSLEYIKYHSLSSSRLVKSPTNSIRYNCEKICSWFRRPKTTLESWKKAKFLWVINSPIIYKLFKDFTNHRKKTGRAVVFSCRTFLNILRYGDHWWTLQQSGRQNSLRHLLKSSTNL